MSELLLAYSWYSLFRLPPKTAGDSGWLIFGLCGNAAFFTRFIVQWLYSEKHKESRIPVIFWYQSLLGTVILLVYFIHKRDPIGILGYVLNVIPYTRNLMLVYRKKNQVAV